MTPDCDVLTPTRLLDIPSFCQSLSDELRRQPITEAEVKLTVFLPRLSSGMTSAVEFLIDSE